jgi:hypothetical protein
MKRFADVEQTRRAYHTDRACNSVHRASLMVPELPDSAVDISFLNHFLLKRNYGDVACRITAIDPEGTRIVSRLVPVDEPKVYSIPLTGMVEETVDSYMVEFFCARNLFIPFPAVMINHRGDGFLNSVHAYNRVLNDVFEDDEINGAQMREAAIDVRFDDLAETFIVFHAGPQPVDGALSAELTLPDGTVLDAEYRLQVPKLCHRLIPISALFPDMPRPVSGGTLKIAQPKQFQFYGRMLVGQRTADGSFSANHSYYDCAAFPEYWDNPQPSSRLYPYLPGYDNRLRFYPIMSPGALEFDLALFGPDGRMLAEETLGRVTTPEGRDLDRSVSETVRRGGFSEDAVSAFRVTARPLDGNTPTRVNHQLVYAAGGLESSINISLGNPNVFVPEHKTGHSWGQVAVGGGIESALGVLGMMPSQDDSEFEVKFFAAEGLVAERRYRTSGPSATVVDPLQDLGDALGPAVERDGTYLWYQISASRPDTNAVAASKHRDTGHAVGEHSF